MDVDKSLDPDRDLEECRICRMRLVRWKTQWLGYSWGRCSRCRSVQKILTNAEYSMLDPTYDPGYNTNEMNKDAIPLLLKQMDVDAKEQVLKEMFGSMTHGKLLDIGCGMGGFLIAGERLGMKVTGVEPSASHCKAAVEIFGLKIVQGYFNPTVLDAPYDAIVLSHVIEHIYDPCKFLSEVISVLRPGGKLLIITPNVESISANVCGRYWSMYKPVDHVTMIGKSAVKFLLPGNASLAEASTSEWPGEFAAHLISALKTFLVPKISNKGGGRGAGTSTKRSTLGWVTKFVLAIVSWPFRQVGAVLDRKSCLNVVIVRNESHD